MSIDRRLALSHARKLLRCALFIAACFLSLTFALPGETAEKVDKTASLKTQMRALWAPASGEYIHNWLLCGEFPIPTTEEDETNPRPELGFANDFLQGQGGEKGIRPYAGMTHTRADGSLASWTKYTSKIDSIEYYQAFAEHPSDNVVWYAYTTLLRAKIGSAAFALEGNCASKLWLNGELVHEHFLTREAGYSDRFAVSLQAGENAVLIKVVQHIGSGHFAFRVLEMAQAEAMEMTDPQLQPALADAESTGDKLTVISDDNRSMPAVKPPVKVEVVAPGGQVVATQSVTRGDRASFNTADWPPGPYDIRCSMSAPNGKRIIAYLLWYHGDAGAALKNLLATAPGADDHTPAGMIHAMLAEMAKDRLGPDIAKADAESLPEAYSELMELAEIQQEQAGGSGPVHGNGFVRLAYRDDIDDSPQFCRVYLPFDYHPEVKYPLIICLHGRADDFPPYIRWGGSDQRHDGLADRYGAIVIYPHARGNAWYRGIGDSDVLHCLALVKERFPIDDDRVYLMGYSMGGAGVWYLGTRHPELFAAIAPFFGGYDFRFQLKDDELKKLTPREQYRRERLSYIAQAEALCTTPVLASHGDTDDTVPVDYSRYTLQMLQRWGYDVRYWESPGKGHGALGNDDAVIQWLLAHKREANPAHVSLRSADLRYAAAHWVKIEQRSDPYAFMQADAEVLAPNFIRLNTENVLEITLSPRPPLIDDEKPLQILWNNTETRTVVMENGSITLRAKGYTPAPLHKRPALEGPANDLYNTPFAIVVGTISPDPLMRSMCDRAGGRLLAWWDERFHCKPRCCKDTEISDPELAKYSLLLIGGAADNAVAKRLASFIPLKIANNAITIDRHVFPVRDAAVQMVYPNPVNPNRYVLVRTATSPAGMYFSDYVLNDVDYCIVDSRAANAEKSGAFFDVITGRNAGPPIAAGYFDNAWHYQDALLERWPSNDYLLPPYWKIPRYASATLAGNRLQLSDLVESKAEGAFLDVQRDRGFAGGSIKSAWKHYDSGLAISPHYWLPKQPCAIEYNLAGGGWKHLRAVISLELPDTAGLSASDTAGSQFEFIVKGDGLELYHSEPLTFTVPEKQARRRHHRRQHPAPGSRQQLHRRNPGEIGELGGRTIGTIRDCPCACTGLRGSRQSPAARRISIRRTALAMSGEWRFALAAGDCRLPSRLLGTPSVAFRGGAFLHVRPGEIR